MTTPQNTKEPSAAKRRRALVPSARLSVTLPGNVAETLSGLAEAHEISVSTMIKLCVAEGLPSATKWLRRNRS